MEEPQEYWEECPACNGSPYGYLCTECDGDGGWYLPIELEKKEDE